MANWWDLVCIQNVLCFAYSSATWYMLHASHKSQSNINLIKLFFPKENVTRHGYNSGELSRMQNLNQCSTLNMIMLLRGFCNLAWMDSTCWSTSHTDALRNEYKNAGETKCPI